MKIISQLLGGEARAKAIRLFLFNPDAHVTLAEVGSRVLIPPAAARKALGQLALIGLVRKTKAKEPTYSLDRRFPYLKPLTDLVAAASLAADERLAAAFASVGRIRLLVASGIFARQDGGRLDLLIVGDEISERRLEQAIKALETDIGRELSYSCLSTADFNYRIGMYDRLIRDVIDFPHVVLIDKVGFSFKK